MLWYIKNSPNNMETEKYNGKIVQIMITFKMTLYKNGSMWKYVEQIRNSQSSRLLTLNTFKFLKQLEHTGNSIENTSESLNTMWKKRSMRCMKWFSDSVVIRENQSTISM